MSENFFDDVHARCPLRIREVSWDEVTLTVAGDGWSFSTVGAWRVSEGSLLKFGCWDENVDVQVLELVGLSILSVVQQGFSIAVDPCFELSDGSRLEVFSTDTFEPWTMSFRDGPIYVS